jgi:muramoyltetrapeptide carboxypeptidase
MPIGIVRAFFVYFYMLNKPDYLQKGDQVIIVAPAGRIKDQGLEFAIEELKQWGLVVVVAKHALVGHHYFSATDEQRLADLQEAIDSMEFKAVFCARGGYGLTRILDRLDFSALINHPKWVVGFSDVTALHIALSNIGMMSVHSLMPTGFELAKSESVTLLKKLLFGEDVAIQALPSSYNRIGNVLAPLIGGNLSLLSASIGTKYELETKGKILFIEEVDEYLYKIDRMLGQLNRSGKLQYLTGLVIGHMSGMKDTLVPFGVGVEELILDHVAQFDYPVLFEAPMGHEPWNLPIIQGGMYDLEVSQDKGTLLPMNI